MFIYTVVILVASTLFLALSIWFAIFKIKSLEDQKRKERAEEEADWFLDFYTHIENQKKRPVANRPSTQPLSAPVKEVREPPKLEVVLEVIEEVKDES